MAQSGIELDQCKFSLFFAHQLSGQGNDRQHRARLPGIALTLTFKVPRLGGLANQPQRKCRQTSDEQQHADAMLVLAATGRQAQAKPLTFEVAKCLFDLHALRIHADHRVDCKAKVRRPAWVPKTLPH